MAQNSVQPHILLSLIIQQHKDFQHFSQQIDNKNGKANMGSRVLWPWIEVKVIILFVHENALPFATMW